MPPSIFSDRRVVFAIATLCALLWGSAVPAVKIGYEVFALSRDDTGSLVLFAGVRFFISGVMLLGLAAATQKPLGMPRREFGEVALLGLMSTTAQYIFYYIGLAHSTGVKVSITTSSSTFFSVLLAHVLYVNDKLTPRRIIGCIIGFAGVVAVNLGAGGFDLNVSLLGEGFIVTAALLFSISGIYGKRISQKIDVMVMTGWQLLLGGALLALLGLVMGGTFTRFGWDAALLMAYLAVLSAAAFGLWSLLMKHNPVGMVAIFNCLIPVFGVLLSGLFLGESVFEWKNLVALVLVSAGIVLVTAVTANGRAARG